MTSTVPELTSDPVGSESYVKLSWKSFESHATEMSRQISDLRQGGHWVDTTLIAGGHKLMVHKLVLSASSLFLRNILDDISVPDPCIILPSDVNIEELSILIEFLYRGEIKLSVGQLPSLSRLAQMLGIPGLPGFTDAVLSKPNEENEWLVEDDESREEEFKDDEMDESAGTNSPEVPIKSPSKLISQGGEAKRNNSGTYSASNVEEGFKLLQSGKSIGQAAKLAGVPRTTLYSKAKSCGVILKQDKEVRYTAQQVEDAVRAVLAGQSLKSAADQFGVSKTVLWRRTQSLRPALPKKKQVRYSSAQKQAAVNALKCGAKARTVAQEFGIPAATLYREKTRLMELGALPGEGGKKRSLEDAMDRQLRVQQAVIACKEGKMSQSSAASHYEVPKTTIWRRLRSSTRCSSNIPKIDLDSNAPMTIGSAHQKESDTDFATFVIDGTNLKLISEEDTMSMESSHYIVLSGSDADSLPGLQVMLPQTEEGSVVCEVEELSHQGVDIEVIAESGEKS
ncbi:uncharacterized protein LOC135944953 [Cloeon dipterum]|uniref:uncharacterized protein LOC135944953 n=1 Tax=Cloeon dipterum TaxID=197152 RepID=UPI0032208C98